MDAGEIVGKVKAEMKQLQGKRNDLTSDNKLSHVENTKPETYQPSLLKTTARITGKPGKASPPSKTDRTLAAMLNTKNNQH
jgi:hypothetical protein